MRPDSRGTRPEPWWITGILESEGSFSVERQGNHFVVSFDLKARDRSLSLVESVFLYFNVGRIYTTKRGFLYRVRQTEELEEIVEHFDRYPLRGPKQAEFLLWREMVLLKKDAFRTAPTQRLASLAAELVATRQTSTRTSTPDGPRVTKRKR